MDNVILKNIAKKFPVLSGDNTFYPLDSGLINNTFLVKNADRDKKYILQKINTDVFSNPLQLLKNAIIINEHIGKKLQNKQYDGIFVNPVFYKTGEGNFFYIDEDNGYWRLTGYIDNEEPDLSILPAIAFESGKLLGYFHYLTNDLDTSGMSEVIPEFHNLEKRYLDFKQIGLDKNIRYENSIDTYKKIEGYSYLVEKYRTLLDKGKLQIRVAHNDPKLSNFLFDKDMKAITLIDWDTIMPGYIGHDFGDAVRTLCNTAEEDEKDMNKVSFDVEVYKQFVKGYFVYAGMFLTDEEKKSLEQFVLFITYEQAIRFYTDFLQGDIYYKTKYDNHNLIRTQNQLKLLSEMISK